MNVGNVARITAELRSRDVAPALASRVARILDGKGLSFINVQSAFRLGRGISWDIVQAALAQVDAEYHVELTQPHGSWATRF